MRIVINIDPIRDRRTGKRMRIRTKYQLQNRDGRGHLPVANAMVAFYNNIVKCIKDGHDPDITDFVDEGERI